MSLGARRSPLPAEPSASIAAFQTIYSSTRQARGSETTVPEAELTELKNYFDGLNCAGASLVLRKWQRNPDYLYALKQVGVTR